MDEILSGYEILIIYLILASGWDLVYMRIPVWTGLFGFFGAFVLSGGQMTSCFIAAIMASGFALLISKTAERIKGTSVLGEGDILIIFIMGIYLKGELYLYTLFYSFVFAAAEAFLFYFGTGERKVPLAAAFLFGTIAAI